MKKFINKISIEGQFAVAYFSSALNLSLVANYQKLRSYRNKYRGKRCFIMGNGPSLNETPLEKLENEYVWGLNRCYLLYDRISWRPKFFTAVDDLVVPDIADEIQKAVTSYTQTSFFFPEEFYRKGLLRARSNVIWFRQRPVDPSKGFSGFFSCNAARYLRVPNTVSITALQLAVYMGFNPIFLIGCDTSYSIPENVDSEGSTFDPGTGEKIDGYVITSKTNNDPNHFSPEYFGAGKKWHNPNVNGMLYGYQMAKEYCDIKGVEVFNATIGGKLEIFPRVIFPEIFKRKYYESYSPAADERAF